MRFRLGFALAAVAAAIGAPALAEKASPLELVGYVKLEKVTTDADGQRRVEWIEPEVVVPGDRLVFGTRFANRGTDPIERFVVSNPVPPSVRVDAGIDPATLVSVDGGRTWGPLAELQMTQTDGLSRPALPGDVTHIRWVLPQIRPGESGTLEFPATVR